MLETEDVRFTETAIAPSKEESAVPAPVSLPTLITSPVETELELPLTTTYLAVVPSVEVISIASFSTRSVVRLPFPVPKILTLALSPELIDMTISSPLSGISVKVV